MDEKKFRFLDLPPELRNRVYFYMPSLIASLPDPERHCPKVRADGGNRVYNGKWFYFYSPGYSKEYSEIDGKQRSMPVQPSISKVCRQIRQETLPIFYGANGFLLVDDYLTRIDGNHTPFPTVILGWLDNISQHLSLMEELSIECGFGCGQRAHEIIAVLTDRYHSLKEGVLKKIERY